MSARTIDTKFGRDVIEIIRESLTYLNPSHIERLTLFAHVEELFPASIISQISKEILQSLASIKILIPHSNTYSLSNIVRRALEDEAYWANLGGKEKGLARAAEGLLYLYRTQYPDTPWWEIPPDGFIHDNLLRLLIAANQRSEAERVAHSQHWWTLRLQQQMEAMPSDLRILGLASMYVEGQDPVQYVLDNIKTNTGILGALRRAAELTGPRPILSSAPFVLIVGDLGDFPLDHLRTEFQLLNGSSLEDGLDFDAVVSKHPLNPADLRQTMSDNTPAFCLDMLSISHPANRIPEVLLSNLKSTLLPRATAPPTWTKHADTLNELLQQRDSAPRVHFTEIYDRYPHFRYWAFYAGTDTSATPVERAALYTFFLARMRPEFSTHVIDLALKDAGQTNTPWYLHWLALEVQTRILGNSSCRGYIMNRHEIPLPRLTLSGLHEQSERLRALVSVFNLAQQYNLIRESLPSGSQRTGRMEEIAATMAISKFDLRASMLEDTLNSKDGGYRLWTYVRSALHGKRGDIEPILGALKRENRNFCMYYGLRCLERLTAGLKTLPAEIRKDLVDLGGRIPNSGDRRIVFDRILRRFPQPANRAAPKKRLPPKRK